MAFPGEPSLLGLTTSYPSGSMQMYLVQSLTDAFLYLSLMQTDSEMLMAAGVLAMKKINPAAQQQRQCHKGKGG